MDRFPKDCWEKDCKHFYIMNISTGNLVCACDILKAECTACDEDFCILLCPKGGLVDG